MTIDDNGRCAKHAPGHDAILACIPEGERGFVRALLEWRDCGAFPLAETVAEPGFEATYRNRAAHVARFLGGDDDGFLDTLFRAASSAWAGRAADGKRLVSSLDAFPVYGRSDEVAALMRRISVEDLDAMWQAGPARVIPMDWRMPRMVMDVQAVAALSPSALARATLLLRDSGDDPERHEAAWRELGATRFSHHSHTTLLGRIVLIPSLSGYPPDHPDYEEFGDDGHLEAWLDAYEERFGDLGLDYGVPGTVYHAGKALAGMALTAMLEAHSDHDGIALPLAPRKVHAYTDGVDLLVSLEFDDVTVGPVDTLACDYSVKAAEEIATGADEEDLVWHDTMDTLPRHVPASLH